MGTTPREGGSCSRDDGGDDDDGGGDHDGDGDDDDDDVRRQIVKISFTSSEPKLSRCQLKSAGCMLFCGKHLVR